MKFDSKERNIYREKVSYFLSFYQGGKCDEIR